MLGNRHLQVKVVKDPLSRTDDAAALPAVPAVDANQISDLVIKHTEHVVKVAGTAYIAKRLFDMTCEITMIIAKAKLK